MSIFKTRGIILKRDKQHGNTTDENKKQIKNWEYLYTIFSYEYGKIRCNKSFSKTEKSLDIWYIANFEITTKENASIHKIRNIKILSEFNSQNKSFSEINMYLLIIYEILKNSPDGNPIFEIFELVEYLNKDMKINEIKLILARLKVKSIFWELNENHENQTISKILKFINKNKIEKILMLTWINQDLKKELETV